MEIDFSQVITQILAFLLMLWVLKKFGWNHFLHILKDRQQKIQEQFDSIASQKAAVQTLQNEYEEKLKEIDSEARHKIQEAIGQGNKIAQELQEEAQVHAKQIIERGKNEAATEVAKARIELKKDLVNMLVATTEKILQQKLDAQQQKKLIADFVDEAKLK